ncbi:MAG: hypothetical protein CMQ17_01195, partial [Gammaproteobacteria bacterium]|nr:hypothetical protein [Gammaproteobacteria bacterium]
SAASTVPEGLEAAIREHYRSTLLSVERLVLDLHSGRIFGAAGALLVDIMAVLFMLMAATGVWIWLRRRSE